MKSINISDYNKIRKVLNYIYIYGCYSRDDFESKNISKSSYDQEISRINQIFDNKEIDSVERERKRYFFFRRDYFNGFENYLINTYTLKNYTDNELPIILMSLCILSANRNISTYKDVLNKIEENNILSEDVDKRSTVERKIKEMKAEGFLIEDSKKNLKVRKPFLDDFSETEIEAIYNYVSFMSKVTYPRVAGAFLKKKIELFAKYNKLSIDTENNFLIRSNNNQNVLDEEIVYKLLELCNKNRMAKLKYKELIDGQYIEVENNICPIKLSIDEKLGRWYLKATINSKPIIIKVRDIIDVKKGKIFDYEKELKICEKNYNCSFISRRIFEKSPYKIRVKLHYNEDNKGFINQFIREMVRGEIIKEDNEQIYQVFINDPIELVPWLRSYGDKIEILDDEFNLKKYMKNSFMEMLENYESVQ